MVCSGLLSQDLLRAVLRVVFISLGTFNFRLKGFVQPQSCVAHWNERLKMERDALAIMNMSASGG